MDVKNFIINILIITSGICWSSVYIDSIRTGFKQKTYCMPLFALGLNIAWEGIYAMSDESLFEKETVAYLTVGDLAKKNAFISG